MVNLVIWMVFPVCICTIFSLVVVVMFRGYWGSGWARGGFGLGVSWVLCRFGEENEENLGQIQTFEPFPGQMTLLSGFDSRKNFPVRYKSPFLRCQRKMVAW